jgi:hypothetical protein
VIVTVDVVVGVNVAVSVTLTKVEAGLINVMLKTGAVDKDVAVTVRFDGVIVLVVQTVEVVMDRYELQKEIAEDVPSTARTSSIAKQLTPIVEADDVSDGLDVMIDVDDADDVVTRGEDDLLVTTDDFDVETLEEVLRLDLPLVLEIGELKIGEIKMGFVTVREVGSIALLEDRDILRVDEVIDRLLVYPVL